MKLLNILFVLGLLLLASGTVLDGCQRSPAHGPNPTGVPITADPRKGGNA